MQHFDALTVAPVVCYLVGLCLEPAKASSMEAVWRSVFIMWCCFIVMGHLGALHHQQACPPCCASTLGQGVEFQAHIY